MWDNRATKRNPRAPDFKCRNRTCEGAVWPEKGQASNGQAPVQQAARPQAARPQAAPSAYVGELPGETIMGADFATLCKRYAECVGYVVNEIAPALEKRQIGIDPETVSSMAACLWIERNKRNV